MKKTKSFFKPIDIFIKSINIKTIKKSHKKVFLIKSGGGTGPVKPGNRCL
ncbi:hypothetical protein N399_22705 [Bacillus licheniformis CG-B52]|nr:hypothetical protein N399_22705 [Bacillus licheniformis CG-B52]KUL12067.1 hypothetical protein LI17339_04345 [Bacillus licheniformis LMG 17339]